MKLGRIIIMKDNDKNDIVFGFYFTPFISSWSILILISGKSSWGPYSIDVIGIKARILGLMILIISLIPAFYIFYKFPKLEGGKDKVREVIYYFIKSSFFYLWLLTIVCLFISKIFNYFIILYIFLLIMCFKYQIDFMKKVKSFINL